MFDCDCDCDCNINFNGDFNGDGDGDGDGDGNRNRNRNRSLSTCWGRRGGDGGTRRESVRGGSHAPSMAHDGPAIPPTPPPRQLAGAFGKAGAPGRWGGPLAWGVNRLTGTFG